MSAPPSRPAKKKGVCYLEWYPYVKDRTMGCVSA